MFDSTLGNIFASGGNSPAPSESNPVTDEINKAFGGPVTMTSNDPAAQIATAGKAVGIGFIVLIGFGILVLVGVAYSRR